MEGNVISYKAKLIAKGYRQIQGIDYDEPFSPIVMLKSIKILLAITASYKAKLIAKGYHQRQGSDYDETFS